VSVSTTTAAILAGGQARRFAGRDKSRLLVGGRAIVVRQIEVLREVASEILVIASDPARFADLGLAVHPDRIPNLGVMGGLYTALEAARGTFVLAIACDLPFLDAGLLRRLVELASDGDGAWVRSPRGVEPLLACYRRASRGRVRAAIDQGRLKASDLGAWLDMRPLEGEDLARFGPIDRLLANVNTPAELSRVQYEPS
jgi:molybdopterin-guanine dinucleotide biosynthesis protein A